MTNLRIIFENSAWFLLLIIPALVLLLLFHFRLKKKFRRTRNRITSLVLYILIMLLTVNVIAGLTFAYEKPITTNEVLLVVDLSYSNRLSETESGEETALRSKNDFIESVVKAKSPDLNIGIVTFGYNQVYAAELNKNAERVLRDYNQAPRPDKSATDISAALLFAQSKFTNAETGKIVLISDGIQTDGDAMSTIAELTSKKITVDTVCFKDVYSPEVQIIDIIFPDYNIIVGEAVNVDIKVKSSLASSFGMPASITLYDNGEKVTSILTPLTVGENLFSISHTFLQSGLHEIYFEINVRGDNITQNNKYYAYKYLDIYDKILILESRTGESNKLADLMRADYVERDRPQENISVLNIKDAPTSLRELRAYDEVILMNVSNADMPKGFAEILSEYVNEYGGGLLTVGGDKENGGANAYNRSDMARTLYQEMLPVDCINYTLPTAVMIVIDRSGSMTGDVGGYDRMELAKIGAKSCVEALSERDWIGVISFAGQIENVPSTRMELPLTRATEKMKINEAIDGIEADGGTLYRDAIADAGAALLAFPYVQRKHILFVSDGYPNDSARSEDNMGFLDYIEHYSQYGITLSAISIGMGASEGNPIFEMARLGNGKPYPLVTEEEVMQLPTFMKQDILVVAIKDYIAERFTPTVNNWSVDELKGIDPETPVPDLLGLYGTRAKNSATVVLAGDFGVPLYARHKYGKGKVGSFMCDLNGTWSNELLNDAEWNKFIFNVVKILSPTESVRARDIEVRFADGNYTKQMLISPYINVPAEEKIEVKVIGPSSLPESERITTFTADKSGNSYLGKLVFSLPGTYEIRIQRINASGKYIGNADVYYQTFSYSTEYDVLSDFLTPENGEQLLIDLAVEGKGVAIDREDPDAPTKVYGGINIGTDEEIDPAVAFIIIVIILFLLDIAVRKFKWKWPWEIIRDYKAKKLLKQDKKVKL